MKRRILVILVFLTIFVYGCSHALTPPSDFPNSKQETNNELIFKVSTNKEEYNVGEAVWLKASVTNIGNAPLEPSLTSRLFQNDFLISIETPYGEIQFIDSEFIGKGVIRGPLTSGRSQASPGEEIVKIFYWDQKVSVPGGEYQVPSGRYTIKAESIFVGEEEALLVPITIKEGSKRFITKEEAIEAASRDSRVINWIEQHKGINNLKEENGEFFQKVYDMGGISGWVKIPEETFVAMSEFEPSFLGSLEKSGVRFIWTVGSHVRIGDPPLAVQVKVDAYDKEIISYRECEKSCR